MIISKFYVFNILFLKGKWKCGATGRHDESGATVRNEHADF